jgi:hypothetical protein
LLTFIILQDFTVNCAMRPFQRPFERLWNELQGF